MLMEEKLIPTGKAQSFLPGYTTAGKISDINEVSIHDHSPVKDTVVVNDRWGSGDRCKNGGYFTCHDHYNPGVL